MGWTRSWLSLGVTCVAMCACAGEASTTPVDAGRDSGLPDVPADTGSPPIPDAAPPPAWVGPHFVQVVTGSYHTCARTDASQVYCWGDDTGLQLGEGLVHRHTCGAPLRRGPCRPFAAPVPALEGAVQIAADGLTTCALRGDGSVACTGQLPLPLPSLPPLVQLTMGAGLVCGITVSADLVCVDPFRGERVREADRVTDITATTGHYCYIREGRVWCGGETWYGELGEPVGHPCRGGDRRDGCPGGIWVDLPVEPVEVEAARHITCVRTIDDEVYCWGRLDEPWTPPTHLPDLDGPARELVVGNGHVCVLRPDGDLDCHDTDRPLPALGPVVSVDLEGGWRRWGPPHGCVVTVDGAVSCWGSDGAGELGRGQWTDRAEPSVERIRLNPVPGWTPRPLPTPTEVGWVPYPTLSEECVIERAERPDLLGPFPVGPCGASSCMRLETPTGARAVLLGRPPGAPGTGGAVPLLTFTATHRMYSLVSMVTGEVLAAVRSPVDYSHWRIGDEYDSCIVDNLAVGGGQAVLTLRSDPFPIRIVYAPIGSLREVGAPTEIGRTNIFGGEVAVGADAFTISASSGLEIHERSVTRVSFAIQPEVQIVGSTVLWHGHRERRLWAAQGLGDPMRLFELSDTVVSAVAGEPGRVAWIEASNVIDGAFTRAELWTAALSSDLGLREPTSFGVVDARVFVRIAMGDGQIAYVATDGDLVLRSVADASERRLAPPGSRWGEVWYIADGYVVTGGTGLPVARTPIDAIPLVSP
ncbi:MAG: hypothetical protein DRJ42_23750 [Deltaproteobacteria bacterium]|nr:MAG: hypothetical protein DRJ42_23750 [Deltaproteobacteria bacterium]